MSSFRHISVVVLALLFGVLFARDFFTRIYTPVEPQERAELAPQPGADMLQQPKSELPNSLASWLEPEPAEDEAAATIAEQATSSDSEPLAGSEKLGELRVRVRAVFINKVSADESLAFAIGERQEIGSGETSRVILRENNKIGGYLVSNIQANYVEFYAEDEQATRRVYVFDPRTVEQSAVRLPEEKSDE